MPRRKGPDGRWMAGSGPYAGRYKRKTPSPAPSSGSSGPSPKSQALAAKITARKQTEAAMTREVGARQSGNKAAEITARKQREAGQLSQARQAARLKRMEEVNKQFAKGEAARKKAAGGSRRGGRGLGAQPKVRSQVASAMRRRRG